MNQNILNKIFNGWKNYVFQNEEIEKMARERAQICAGCEHANEKFLFKLMLPDGKNKFIEGLGCDICSCPLTAATRSPLKQCPKGKW